MSMLCVYCAGGLGRDFLSLLEATNTGNWEEVVFIDDVTTEKVINNVRVFNFQEFQNKGYIKEQCEFVVLNGEPLFRKQLFQNILNYEYKIAKVIFKSTVVAQNSCIGQGSIIHCQSIVSSDSTIEENVFIGKKAMIGHDVHVGKHSVISACSYIGGWVNIGEGCFIGAGAVIKDRVDIGKSSVVGIGSVVINDVPDNTVVVGNPARFLRKNEKKIVFN